MNIKRYSLKTAVFIIALSGAMMLVSSCKKQIGPDPVSDPDISIIPSFSKKLIFRNLPYKQDDFPFRYQTDFRGDFPADGGPLSLWFARRGNEKIRMDFIIIGPVRYSMTVQAPNKSEKEMTCTIEDVKNRKGCTLKIESDADVFLITIKHDPRETKKQPIEFYLNIKSRDKTVFMR